MINPEEYTVSVRMESVEGERKYVARIQELPDVEEYADTPEFARELALDTIATIYEICQEKGLSFPSPNVAQAPEASGRVTLRLAKSIHAAAIQRAQLEGISLNQFMSNSISSALVKVDSFEVAREAFLDLFNKHSEDRYQAIKSRDVRDNVFSNFISWESDSAVGASIERTSTDTPMELNTIRSAARLGTLDFDLPNVSVITQAFKMRLPVVEPSNKGRRQQMYFVKAGA